MPARRRSSPDRPWRGWASAGPLIVGMGCELTALVILGFATQGWILFALAPLFALGGIGMPALQSLTTHAGRRRQPGQAAGRAGEPRQPRGGVRAAVL